MNDLILSKDAQIELWDFSCKLAKSQMVPLMYQNKNENIFAAILMGREFNIGAMGSLYAFISIQGTITMKVSTMNGIVRAKCPSAIIEIKIDHVKKEARVIAKRDKDDIGYESLWTMDMAKQMGLAGRDQWVKQPMNMLKARALSDALRTVFADVLMGLYSTEEMEDLPPLRETMSQTLRREVELESPTPPEEKIAGPLYRFSNGKFIGSQLKDHSKEVLELEYERLVGLLKKLPWQKDLCFILSDYLTNYDSFAEMRLELIEASDV